MKLKLTAIAAAASLLQLACGGGGAAVVADNTPPTVAITDNITAQDATTSVTFSFDFSEDVGTSFAADDILVSGGVAGAFTRLSATFYTLVVTPIANTAGTLSVSVSTAKFVDTANNANVALVMASQSFNTVAQLPGWTLVWSDEFSVNGLPDATKWSYDTEHNQTGWFNNEKQYYSANRLENASVQNGMLSITARKENLTSAADYGNQPYTSARLITRGKGSWTYGFYEVRAKLPCSLGTWPAIWTLGTGGRWPEDGEIDIMEQRGTSAAAKGEVLGTIHTKAYNYFGGTLGVGQGASTTVADACTNFHNYQLTWSVDKIVMAVDGAPYFEFLNPKDANYDKWPFDKPQFMILNLAMGGDLGGGIPATFVSDQMVVDYVRVYQK